MNKKRLHEMCNKQPTHKQRCFIRSALFTGISKYDSCKGRLCQDYGVESHVERGGLRLLVWATVCTIKSKVPKTWRVVCQVFGIPFVFLNLKLYISNSKFSYNFKKRIYLLLRFTFKHDIVINRKSFLRSI